MRRKYILRGALCGAVLSLLCSLLHFSNVVDEPLVTGFLLLINGGFCGGGPWMLRPPAEFPQDKLIFGIALSAFGNTIIGAYIGLLVWRRKHKAE